MTFYPHRLCHPSTNCSKTFISYFHYRLYSLYLSCCRDSFAILAAVNILKKSVIVLVLTTGSNVYWAYIMSVVLSGRSSADVPLTCVCQRSCLTFKCRCTLLSSSHLLHMVVLPSSFLCIFLQLIPIDQSRRYELLSLAIYTVLRKKGYILF